MACTGSKRSKNRRASEGRLATLAVNHHARSRLAMVRANARRAASQQRSRRRPLHMVSTAVGALATMCALVAGCDASVGVGDTVVDKDALQTDIADRLAKAGEHAQS